MLSPPCQQALHLYGPLGNLVSRWKVLESAALGAEMIMFVAGSCAVKDLEVNDRARTDQSAVDERRCQADTALPPCRSHDLRVDQVGKRASGQFFNVATPDVVLDNPPQRRIDRVLLGSRPEHLGCLG